MHCPFCAAVATKVIDSRLSSAGDKIRRRRECPQCGARLQSETDCDKHFDGRRP